MIEPDLLGFIRAAVRSVWALELLILMRASADRSWTLADLVREMRASERLVGEILQTFEDAGMVMRLEEDRFRYAPASPLLDKLSGDLERTYRTKPVKVVNAIVAASESKVQSLADAFRFRDGSK